MLATDAITRGPARSVLDLLRDRCDTPQGHDAGVRPAVIHKALDILLAIHKRLCDDNDDQRGLETLHDPIRKKTVDGILDLISLEGIYPSLSAGVGVPLERRVKSVLQGGIVSKSLTQELQGENQDKALLSEIIQILWSIIEARGKGLQPAVEDRILVDIIAGTGELVFTPPTQLKRPKEMSTSMFDILLAG